MVCVPQPSLEEPKGLKSTGSAFSWYSSRWVDNDSPACQDQKHHLTQRFPWAPGCATILAGGSPGNRGQRRGEGRGTPSRRRLRILAQGRSASLITLKGRRICCGHKNLPVHLATLVPAATAFEQHPCRATPGMGRAQGQPGSAAGTGTARARTTGHRPGLDTPVMARWVMPNSRAMRYTNHLPI